MDLSQAEAVMDVIHARSERALTAANQQLRGALGRQMGVLIDGLLGVLARIEAYIDFPDEDLPAEDRATVVREVDRLSQETERLLATGHYGELLRDGIKTVIVGEPNVGKSSLLNRLVGRERALVSPEPGTTRDFIEERIMLGPHCLRLIDTAGLNASPAPLERLGIDKTRERLAEADLVLVVLDATVRPFHVPPELAKLPTIPLMILNKSDLCDFSDETTGDIAGQLPIWLSARTGTGLDELVTAIVARADAFQNNVGGETIAINARHAHALAAARMGLRSAREKLESSGPVELLASDLRDVLAAYGEITGKVSRNERFLI
jgi:tRNA modification GTPase